ncbi:hypothetical protein RhiJN_02783 [Ceratobasidium sp. AG-Ba]|nr:hypothetical protein RhiJN_02783 [Ceratobasidium sp. AG-Ba]
MSEQSNSQGANYYSGGMDNENGNHNGYKGRGMPNYGATRAGYMTLQDRADQKRKDELSKSQNERDAQNGGQAGGPAHDGAAN